MVDRSIILNGQAVSVSVPDDSEYLLFVLRERLGQRGPKFGCGVRQCSTCVVLIDGVALRSCMLPLNTVPETSSVRTADGLATQDGDGSTLHPLQEAFLELQAGQCSYCVSGIMMGALAWLEGRHAAGNRAVPSRQEVADHLAGKTPASNIAHICRCGAHNRIMEAIRKGAEKMA